MELVGFSDVVFDLQSDGFDFVVVRLCGFAVVVDGLPQPVVEVTLELVDSVGLLPFERFRIGLDDPLLVLLLLELELLLSLQVQDLLVELPQHLNDFVDSLLDGQDLVTRLDQVGQAHVACALLRRLVHVENLVGWMQMARVTHVGIYHILSAQRAKRRVVLFENLSDICRSNVKIVFYQQILATCAKNQAIRLDRHKSLTSRVL